jgi:hypothetical protein
MAVCAFTEFSGTGENVCIAEESGRVETEVAMKAFVAM